MILKCCPTDINWPLNSCLLRYWTLPALTPRLQTDTLADRRWERSGQIKRLEDRGRWVKRITESILISPSIFVYYILRSVCECAAAGLVVHCLQSSSVGQKTSKALSWRGWFTPLLSPRLCVFVCVCVCIYMCVCVFRYQPEFMWKESRLLCSWEASGFHSTLFGILPNFVLKFPTKTIKQGVIFVGRVTDGRGVKCWERFFSYM